MVSRAADELANTLSQDREWSAVRIVDITNTLQLPAAIVVCPGERPNYKTQYMVRILSAVPRRSVCEREMPPEEHPRQRTIVP